jgi:alanine dehydrogenase
MFVGVLKEIKPQEKRVALVPAGAHALKMAGQNVLVEHDAGLGSGFPDEDYVREGAEIVATPAELFARSDMVMLVKEPQPSQCGLIRHGQILFDYLHLAACEPLTRKLVDSGAACIAYETIQKADGSLPLLTPMSEVAGRMSVVEGAKCLQMHNGGRGVFLGGVPGVEPATVVVIGGGVVGMNAAKMACGLGAKVYVLDKDLARLRYLNDVMPANCFTVASSPAMVREMVMRADLVIGAVLVTGAKAPKLITRDMLSGMKPGSVIVDVAIDQGGCVETSRPTTHGDPTFTVDGVVHYCVANMPGAFARTSTLALTSATLPYAVEIARWGWLGAMRRNSEIKLGANVVGGNVTCRPVAEAFGMPYTDIDDLHR